MAPEELRLDTRAGRFGGLAWRRPGAERILCVHGWLDNAASFLPLAPLLDRYDIVALDLAGHGQSQHRPAGTRYHMVDNLWDLDAVLDALEWERCHLLGHSLGGVVTTTYAAAEPERVASLMVLDGLGPLSAAPGDTVPRLRRALHSVRKASGRLRDYPDAEAAAQARHAASGLPLDCARVICSRALDEVGGVFRWRTDPALNWHSPALLSEPQVREIIAAIQAPVLAINSTPVPDWIGPERVADRVNSVLRLTRHEIAGHHHFHMDQPEPVAQWILEFLSAQEAAA
ncbi:MAG: alpha/beta fold hydrolase [Xanthomonadales bacterium]|nr:alpha/beta fold hydrolase [Xanthomonadales bacterium]